MPLIEKWRRSQNYRYQIVDGTWSVRWKAHRHIQSKIFHDIMNVDVSRNEVSCVLAEAAIRDVLLK